jgi:hypothetical protein
MPLSAAASQLYNIMFCRVEPWSENSQATPTAVDIVAGTEGNFLLFETSIDLSSISAYRKVSVPYTLKKLNYLKKC